jgi:hypothetical protein
MANKSGEKLVEIAEVEVSPNHMDSTAEYWNKYADVELKASYQRHFDQQPTSRCLLVELIHCVFQKFPYLDQWSGEYSHAKGTKKGRIIVIGISGDPKKRCSTIRIKHNGNPIVFQFAPKLRHNDLPAVEFKGKSDIDAVFELIDDGVRERLGDNQNVKRESLSPSRNSLKELDAILAQSTKNLIDKDTFDKEFQTAVMKSQTMSSQARHERLAVAARIPERVRVVSTAFKRNPDVVAEVLVRANGRCEECGLDAPFLRTKDNTPYLEIHHKVTLADDGEDTVDNAVALCPNCHREMHFG